jgi:hypothetical protein
MSENTEIWTRLRAPFNPGQINKLPKPYKRDSPSGKCNECGGYHGMPAMHLDYVGHAALTDRLLEVDPEWSWEPVSMDQDGLPKFDNFGGLWIRLTIGGVTRLGYGDAAGKNNANGVKEAIGDALRNAGMRFGVALDLWHKGDLWAAKEEQGIEGAEAPAPRPTPVPQPAADTPPAFDPNWMQENGQTLEKRVFEAKGDVSQLRTIWSWANGTGAPPEVLDRLKAISTGVAA